MRKTLRWYLVIVGTAAGAFGLYIAGKDAFAFVQFILQLFAREGG
jgi:hypothetical protein